MTQSLFSRIVLLAGLFLFSGCHSVSKPETQKSESTAPVAISTYFESWNGCFLLYDLKKNKWDEVYNQERCEERHAPCSTFKVPLALMGFETGVLKDESTLFKWDGKQRSIPAWNQDHTAATWMSNSVVWYSQLLTPQMGRKKIQSFINKFDYGNKDFSGGLKDAWLTPAPIMDQDPTKSSIKISGYEQIEFLKKLWTEKLPVSQRSMELTQKIMFLETSPKGFTLQGKTGTGYTGPGYKQRLGWFIAHIEGNGQEYLAVVNLNDLPNKPGPDGFASSHAKEIMKKVLVSKGLF